ncbi:hypothetical protein [Desulfosarcina sp.]|uniref:hypothetical protein n=1 Tax=Desulfosarcina sp. TaxID=2027861 RepID=UPI00356B2017
MMRLLKVAIGLIAALPAMVFAGEADVTRVEVRQTASGIFHFDVTVRHDDTGWDHYADRWEVLAPDGTLLGTRTLYHPHVDEQPFTRSLSGVAVAETILEVTVRAHDSVHAFGGKTVTMALPR